MQWDDTGIAEAILEKINAGTLTGWIVYTDTADTLIFIHLWTTNPAIRWGGTVGGIAGGGYMQLVVTYDGGAVGNDPQPANWRGYVRRGEYSRARCWRPTRTLRF